MCLEILPRYFNSLLDAKVERIVNDSGWWPPESADTASEFHTTNGHYQEIYHDDGLWYHSYDPKQLGGYGNETHNYYYGQIINNDLGSPRSCVNNKRYINSRNGISNFRGNTGSLSPGAIVGIAVGGAVLIAAVVVLVLALVRRRKRRGSDTGSVLHQDTGRDDVVEEKHFPHPISVHTTGRADQPKDPYRPASGAFEMDASSAAPIELPAVSISSPSTKAHKASRLEPVQEAAPTDPRANLTSVPTDDGKPVYVNHWNQYKNLA
ncbi:hypothetical protein Trco_001020 [Trichoderma cornu-damae]|uniref:Uncharacterized protein n=1 Tax=Trichoderma cornu-damae TaxID=654480 RepID=A0A9P8QRG5_9HYPO|nr:hypothetical protein Trco_001020 [Trichoderma cornu-damae]